MSIQIMRAVRKKCSCSFSAIAGQRCLALCRSATSVGKPGSLAAEVQTLFWGTGLAPGWAERGGKLLKVGSLHPCEYMSSEELAVSGQGKAAAKRKLPSSKKSWREIDWMTVKGKVWVENVLAVAHKCAAPSFESAAVGRQTNRTWVGGFKECWGSCKCYC